MSFTPHSPRLRVKQKTNPITRHHLGGSASTLAIALTVACNATDKAPPLPPATTVRDSAGIEIVESHRPAWQTGEEWTIEREPSLAIGKEDGAAVYLFDRVKAATRLTDGRIVVADDGSRSLRFFDRNGVFIKSVGRGGVGPGEFASLNSLFRFRGDSLMTHDDRNSFIVFDSEGRLVDSRKMSEGVFVLDLHGALADGTVMRRVGGEGHKALSEAESDSILFQNLDRTGEVRARFAFSAPRRPGTKFAGHPTFSAVVGGPGPRPVLEKHYVLQTHTSFAVGPTNIYFGDSDRFEFLVASGNGAISRIMRVTAPLEKIPESVKTDSATFNFGKVRYTANETIWPDVYPPFRQLMADRVGNLWAEKVRRSGETLNTVRYTVFDSTGAMLGEVALPAKLHVYEIGSDYVLGLERNSLDVESVKLYPLRKPGRR